jgi:hypothetical protein
MYSQITFLFNLLFDWWFVYLILSIFLPSLTPNTLWTSFHLSTLLQFLINAFY